MKILSVLYIVILISLSSCNRFSFFSRLFNKKEETKLSSGNETMKMKKTKKAIESVKINDDEFMLQLEMKKYDIEKSNALSEMMF